MRVFLHPTATQGGENPLLLDGKTVLCLAMDDRDFTGSLQVWCRGAPAVGLQLAGVRANFVPGKKFIVYSTLLTTDILS